MAGKVKIFNDNEHPFEANFKGDKVYIGAKSYWKDKDGTPRLFDLFEANDFKGDYHPIKLLGDGTHDPRTFKKIKLVNIDAEVKEVVPEHPCMLCGSAYQTEDELDVHLEAEHKNEERVSIAELDKAEIKAQPRPRGRPRAQATA
jgi:hypothetical protein